MNLNQWKHVWKQFCFVFKNYNKNPLTVLPKIGTTVVFNSLDPTFSVVFLTPIGMLAKISVSDIFSCIAATK